MSKNKITILLPYYFLVLLLFAADRFLKYFVLNQTAVDSSHVRGFFNLEKNSGVAFSIHIPSSILYFLLIIILILLISTSVKYFRAQKYLLHTTTLLVIAGAISNLIDRAKFGFVVDYFDFKFWPVFNLADVMIVVGVGLWILKLGKKAAKNNKSINAIN